MNENSQSVTILHTGYSISSRTRMVAWAPHHQARERNRRVRRVIIDDGVDNSLVLSLDCSASYHASFSRETVVVLSRLTAFLYGEFPRHLTNAHVRGQVLTRLPENKLYQIMRCYIHAIIKTNSCYTEHQNWQQTRWLQMEPAWQ